MGADLCGYVFLGPSRLRKRDIERARQHLGAVKGLSQQYPTVDPDADLSDEYQPLIDAAEALSLDVEGFVELYGDDLKDGLLDTFVALWHGEDHRRDMMSRPAPRKMIAGRKPYQIFVAGERTWGDGPERDSAWWVCQMVDALGLPHYLGIG